MSGNIQLQPASFPDKEKIIAYINTHPHKEKIDSSFFDTNYPNSLNRVADLFANQTLPKHRIIELLQRLFKKDFASDYVHLHTFGSFVHGHEKTKNGMPIAATKEMRIFYARNKAALDREVNFPAGIYNECLRDLIEKKIWYPPPCHDEKGFKKHVVRINKM